MGNYTATIAAINSVSEISATTSVSIIDVSITGLAAANDSPTDLGKGTLLWASANTGTNVDYAWDLGDGTTGSGWNATHTYPDIGNFTATVTATNSVSEIPATTSVSIIDVVITGLKASNDSPTKVGHGTLLWASIGSGTNVNYTWDFGDGTTGIGWTATHTYPDIGNYTATVTSTNSVSQISATTAVMIVESHFLPIVLRQ